MSEVPGESAHSSRRFSPLNIALLVFFLVYAAIMIHPPWHFFLELWDESRNATNALEMATLGHWSTAYFGGVPDHWNTKPLLLIWIMAGLMKLGVAPQIALRVPSAIAAMATVAMLYVFCRRRLQRPLAAVFSSLLLMAAVRFVGYHVAVSADFDSLLTFFVTAYLLAFWLYVEAQPRDRGRWLLLTFLALSGAIATKGIAAMMVMPGVLIFVIVARRLKQVLLDPKVWLTLVAAAAFTAVLYGVREHFDPGYVNAVWHNEISGRYTAVNEGNDHPAYYYVQSLLAGFEPGMLAALLGLSFLIRKRFDSSAARSAALFCLVVPTIFVIVISVSKTKLQWYSAPAVPLYSILGGLGIDAGLTSLARYKPSLSRLTTGAVAAILFVMAAVVLYRAQGPVRLARESREEVYHPLLTDMQSSAMTGPIVLYDDGEPSQHVFANYAPVAQFYVDLARSHGQQITMIGDGDAIPPAAWIITCDPPLLKTPPAVFSSPNTRTMDGCLVTASPKE